MRSVRIVSTGPTGMGTKVLDAATGQPIKGVGRIELDPISPDEITTAKVFFLAAEVEAEAQARFYIMGLKDERLNRREIKRIEFADGETWEA